MQYMHKCTRILVVVVVWVAPLHTARVGDGFIRPDPQDMDIVPNCIWPFYCSRILGMQHTEAIWSHTLSNATFLASLPETFNIDAMMASGGCSSIDAELRLQDWIKDTEGFFLASNYSTIRAAEEAVRHAECDAKYVAAWLQTMGHMEQSEGANPGPYGIVFARSFVDTLRMHPALRQQLAKLRRDGNEGAFVVVGSSTGMECVYARIALGVRRVMGVELSCEAVTLARQIAMDTLTTEERDGLEYRCADAYDVDFDRDVPGGALLTYIDDAGWDAPELSRLASKLDRELPPSAAIIAWQLSMKGLPCWKQSRRAALRATWAMAMDSDDDVGASVWVRSGKCHPGRAQRVDRRVERAHVDAQGGVAES